MFDLVAVLLLLSSNFILFELKRYLVNLIRHHKELANELEAIRQYEALVLLVHGLGREQYLKTLTPLHLLHEQADQLEFFHAP